MAYIEHHSSQIALLVLVRLYQTNVYQSLLEYDERAVTVTLLWLNVTMQ